MKKILAKIVCFFIDHLYPFPRHDGSAFCYRCHEYLGEIGQVYKYEYKVTAYNRDNEII